MKVPDEAIGVVIWANGEVEIFMPADYEQHEQPGTRPFQAFPPVQPDASVLCTTEGQPDRRQPDIRAEVLPEAPSTTATERGGRTGPGTATTRAKRRRKKGSRYKYAQQR